MTIFDILVFFTIGSCFLFSLFKGMVREVFSLLGYLAGYIGAINYYDDLAVLIQSMVKEEVMARIAGFSIIFILVKIITALTIFFMVKIIFSFLGKLIRRFIDGTRVLSLPDRIIGGIMGLAKGLVIVAIIMFPLKLFEESYKRITQGSLFAPYLEGIVHVVKLESKDTILIDKIKNFSSDEFKKKFNVIGDLDKLKDEITIKTDKLLKTVRGSIKNNNKEKTMEAHTDDDKNKLKNLLNKFAEE